MCADTIVNPAIPCTGSIPGGVFPSKSMFVQGFVPNGSTRFHVNFQIGAGDKVDDVAFHFNPRFSGKPLVVCNTKTGGRWGAEERHDSNFPFVQGQNFELIIRCDIQDFKVAVNGRHFLQYRHRMTNLQTINAFCIAGQVNVYTIRFDPPSTRAPCAGAHPGPAAPVYPVPSQPVFPSGPKTVVKPSLPYMDTIPGGMREGLIIVVKITVKPNPTRFHVNFQCGMSTNPRSDVAFQFNPRFNQKLINLNTLRNTKWDDKEEKHRGYFPFHPNGTYDMMFLCERQMFKVALNGSHLLEYNHRLPFQNITVLQIDGDCVVTQVVYH